jgi:hypothetical protein
MPLIFYRVLTPLNNLTLISSTHVHILLVSVQKFEDGSESVHCLIILLLDLDLVFWHSIIPFEELLEFQLSQISVVHLSRHLFEVRKYLEFVFVWISVKKCREIILAVYHLLGQDTCGSWRSPNKFSIIHLTGGRSPSDRWLSHSSLPDIINFWPRVSALPLLAKVVFLVHLRHKSLLLILILIFQYPNHSGIYLTICPLVWLNKLERWAVTDSPSWI